MQDDSQHVDEEKDEETEEDFSIINSFFKK